MDDTVRQVYVSRSSTWQGNKLFYFALLNLFIYLFILLLSFLLSYKARGSATFLLSFGQAHVTN